MTGTGKAVRVLFPRDFTAFVRADCRYDLVVLRGQDKHVVLFSRDGPACDLLSDDLSADWLWTTQLRDRRDVEPCICCGGEFWAEKAKRGAANGREDGGEWEKLEK